MISSSTRSQHMSVRLNVRDNISKLWNVMASGMEFRYEGNEQKDEPSYERFRVLKHFVRPQLT